VDAVVAERPGQRRVLHLLRADDHHGRVAKSADVQRLLELGVGGALGPEPAPILLLELVAHLVEHRDVFVAALALAVEDVRQEGNDTERVIVAIVFKNFVTGDLTSTLYKRFFLRHRFFGKTKLPKSVVGHVLAGPTFARKAMLPLAKFSAITPRHGHPTVPLELALTTLGGATHKDQFY
jgi:hypothetical protein